MIKQAIEKQTLPKGWREVMLGEVCHFKRGPFGSSLRKGIFVKEGYAVYEQRHAIHNSFNNVRYFISEMKFQEMKEFEISFGDLIMSCSGTMGKSAIVPRGAKRGIINQALLRITPQSATLSIFFFNLWMNSNNFRKNLQQVTFGNAIKNVAPVKVLKQIAIIIPPLPEQKAIASLLEKWDEAIEKTEALIEAKEKRFRWLLKALISAQQDNPKWQKVKLGDICRVFKGQGLSKELLDSRGDNKCILYGQLYTLYPEIIEQVISRTESNKGVLSEKGDVLIPGSTTTQGIDLANATALFEDGVLLGGDINILRGLRNDLYDSSFLAYCLTHSKKREIARYTQGVTIIHLYGKDLKEITVSLPSIQSQKEIIYKIHTSRREIDLLKQQAARYREQKRGLMQKLLTGEWRIRGCTH